MVVFNHPQPALLFLVPGVTGAVVIYALISGEFKSIYEYSEEDHREKKEEVTPDNSDESKPLKE